MMYTKVFLINGLYLVIIILILFFVIKGAVKAALKESKSDNRSAKDTSTMQVKILTEIAKKSGVSEEELNKILFPQN